jgi:(E)-2-((N-methylformamido)methylene)succinate hydrolase
MTLAVLVHGVGLDQHMWSDFSRVCGFPTYAYDLLGLGKGPHRPGPYQLSDYRDQLAAHIGPSTVDVIGFSMGALVAQRFAIDYPHRVRRLVLVSGVFDRSPDEQRAIKARVVDVRHGKYADSIEPALTRWFTDSFTSRRPDVVEQVRKRMYANDIDAYTHAYDVFATGDAELVGAVGRLASPTLVITGELDQRSTPLMAQRLAAALPAGQCHIMSGLKHLVPLEAPAELAAVVQPFLIVACVWTVT